MLPRKSPIPKKRSQPRAWICRLCKVKQRGLKTCLECKARKGVKRTNLKAKCDRLARELCMRLADGKCARCGGVGTDWAHRWPRRHHSLRWSMLNCDLLCRPCHQHFTTHPHQFASYLNEKLGERMVNELEDRANAQWDRDYQKVIAYLESYK